jgi:hypothetical protein
VTCAEYGALDAWDPLCRTFFFAEGVAMSLKKQLDVNLRIAIVQLQCHLAAFIGGRDFLAEPYVDEDILPLDYLTRSQLPTEGVRKQCRNLYLEWAQIRIQAVLDYIEEVATRDERTHKDDSTRQTTEPPKHLVIVFPEYSIPFEHLSLVRRWAVKNKHLGIVLFAGTHSLPARTQLTKSIYHDLREGIGFQQEDIEKAYSSPLPSRSILPIFYYDHRTGEIVSELRLKRILSPFELTNMGDHTFDPEQIQKDLVRVPFRLSGYGGQSESQPKLTLDFLPMICSEALQTTIHTAESTYDIAVIPSYNKSWKPFESTIEQISRNQHLVIYCNDGLYGGSQFAMPPSRRGEGWWLGHPNKGVLPKGDAVLMADVRTIHLADVSEVHNPPERCKLLKLSAVVPRNAEQGSFIVSECLRALRHQEEQCGDLNLERRRRILKDCVELRRPTPLQTLKLNRLLSLENIDSQLWSFHGDDVVYPYPKPEEKAPPSDPEEPRPPTDLLALETKLTQMCLEHIHNIESVDGLTDDQHHALSVIVQRFHERNVRNKSTIRAGSTELPDIAWTYLKDVAHKSAHESKRILTESVAEIVEQFKATSAWVFAYAPQRPLCEGLKEVPDLFPLKPILSHNGPHTPALAMQNCMAGACATTLKPVVYPTVLYRFAGVSIHDFHPVKPSSRSGVAVPLFLGNSASASENLIGVLVLESNHPFAFSHLDAEDLFVECRALAPALLFQKLLHSSHDRDILWFAPFSDWNITRVLNDLCYTLAASAPPGFGMTIWKADARYDEKLKDKQCNVAYALGAVRFDNDYLNQRTLPIWKTNDSKEPLGPASFVGSLIGAPAGTYKATDWRKDRYFQRQEKASRTELDWIFGTNISSTQGVQHAISQTQWSKENAIESSGAITFYTYEGTTALLKARLAEPPLSRLATIVGRFLEAADIVVTNVAQATLDARLQNDAITGVNMFNIVRDVLMDIFDADGCTIFARSSKEGHEPRGEASDVLKCVTTSGLNADGKEQLREKAEYSDLVSGSPHLTVRIVAGENKSDRFNVGEAVKRKGIAPRRMLESYTLSELEHRRILIQAITADTADRPNDSREGNRSDSLGVVRIIRSVRKRPFTPEDARLLESLVPILRLTFELRNFELGLSKRTNWDEMKQLFIEWYSRRWKEEALQAGAGPGHNELVKRIESRQGLFEAACRRLLVTVPNAAPWNRRAVERTLQDLYHVLDCDESVLAMIRIVDRDESGAPFLRIHSFHGYSHMQLREEGEAEPLLRIEGGIGWDCVKDKTVIYFEREDDGYTTLVSQCQKDVKSGLCFACTLPFQSKPTTAVISIEYGKNKRPSMELEQAMLLFAAGAQLCKRAAMAHRQTYCQGSQAYDVPDNATHDFLFELEKDLHTLLENDLLPPHDRKKVRLSATVFQKGRDEKERETPDLFYLPLKKANRFWRDLAKPDVRFDPSAQVSAFVERKMPREHPNTRAFTRRNLNLEEECFRFSLLGVRLDLKTGRFVVPLTVAGALAGNVVGDVDVRDLSEGSAGEVCCKVIAQILSTWGMFADRWDVIVGAWKVQFLQQGDRRKSRNVYKLRCELGGKNLIAKAPSEDAMKTRNARSRSKAKTANKGHSERSRRGK